MLHLPQLRAPCRAANIACRLLTACRRRPARFVRCLAELRAAAEPADYEAFCSSPAAAALCGAGGPDGTAGAGGLWWTVRLAAGHTAELVRGGRGRPVCLADRERYAEVALRARLREFDPAVAAMKQVPPCSPRRCPSAALSAGCCHVLASSTGSV